MAETSNKVLVLFLTKGHDLVDTGKCTHILREDRCVIGRGTAADWVLPDPANQLSRTHCRIERKNNDFRIIDTSSNGTYVNDWEEPIPDDEYRDLHDGDIIHVGGYYIFAQILPEGANERISEDDYLLEPASSDPFADILPEGQGEDFDEWVDDQILSSADELSAVLSDPLEAPETILRQTTESFEFPVTDERASSPPVSYGFERYQYANTVPFESESGTSSEKGASAWDHNRTETDAFKLPRAKDQTIPEDWDVDPMSEAESEAKKSDDD